MKVFLSRVSTDEQSELRQIQNVEGFDKVIIDKCSGLVDLWNRPNIVKNKIKKLVDKGTNPLHLSIITLSNPSTF